LILHKQKIFTARLLRRCPMPLPDLFLLSESGWHPLAQDTRVKHSRTIYYKSARGLFIYKSLSRDTAALHVYKTHDRIAISIGGINTTRRRVLVKHTMNTEQGLSPTRKKTKSIVSNPSPLVYAYITFNIDSVIRPNY